MGIGETPFQTARNGSVQGGSGQPGPNAGPDRPKSDTEDEQPDEEQNQGSDRLRDRAGFGRLRRGRPVEIRLDGTSAAEASMRARHGTGTNGVRGTHREPPGIEFGNSKSLMFRYDTL
jgi:hypothetical protein